ESQGRRRQKGERRRGGEKPSQNYRERHSGVVGSERTESSEPECGRRNETAGRVESARSQTIGDTHGQDARGEVDESLCEHACLPAGSGQEINAGQKCGIAGRARIRGQKLPV